MILGDPLILDPLHPLFMFLLFNIATSTFRLSFWFASFLVICQVLTCFIGLLIREYQHFGSSFVSYLVNDFLALILAYLFALLSAYPKEQLMRQVFHLI
jgi:hypothetical protein